MGCERRLYLEAANAELAAARASLEHALEAPWDDDGATEVIAAAFHRLRAAQARQTAARTGLTHLADLVAKD